MKAVNFTFSTYFTSHSHFHVYFPFSAYFYIIMVKGLFRTDSQTAPDTLSSLSLSGHLRVSDVRSDRLSLLLHRVCLHLPSRPQLQLQALQPHGLLRLLGEVSLQGPRPRV